MTSGRYDFVPVEILASMDRDASPQVDLDLLNAGPAISFWWMDNGKTQSTWSVDLLEYHFKMWLAEVGLRCCIYIFKYDRY